MPKLKMRLVKIISYYRNKKVFKRKRVINSFLKIVKKPLGTILKLAIIIKISTKIKRQETAITKQCIIKVP